MKLISIITPTCNEEENVLHVYREVRDVFRALPQYRHEHLFIDNASRDRTVEILKEIAQQDPTVRIIVNMRNFGHIRSPFHGLLQARGDAAILFAADLQDPPSLIPQFLALWEQGFPVVIGAKEQSDDRLFVIRRLYYKLISVLSGVELIQNFTGFGLYDRSVLDVLRTIEDPYPYFRGLIAELGFPRATIPYRQPARKRGLTKNNFYTLYDMAMLGITSHSKVPLRLATMLGFALSLLGFLVALGYLVAKLIFWQTFQAGIAPLVIGVFTFLSVQLFFIGLLGEYIAAIHTQVLKRPRVIERERVNFDEPEIRGVPEKREKLLTHV